MKLTTKEFIDLCSAISDVHTANDHLEPVFNIWAKKLKAKYQDELDFWNSLTVKEQAIVSDDIIEIDMPVLNIKYAPEIYLNSHADILSTIFTEKLPQRVSQIESKLKQKKEAKK